MMLKSPANNHEHRTRAFTIVELLVVVSIIGLLIGLLLPALGRVREGAKQAACASNLRQIYIATQGYLNAYDNHLPQVAWTGGPEPPAIIGALFGGKRGTLPVYGIDQYGPLERPLNKFLSDSVNELDNEVPVFECPMDRGQSVPVSTSSLYDLTGSSYVLNDHTLDGDEYHTLIPKMTGSRLGGKMPSVTDPSRTWMIGDHVIYNFQEMGNRGQDWHFNDHICNLCFVDGHTQTGVRVPGSTADVDPPDESPNDRAELFTSENTTPDYTFLPTPTWLQQQFAADSTIDAVGPWQAGDRSPGTVQRHIGEP